MHIEFEDDDLSRLYTDPLYKPARLGTEVIKHFRRKLQLLAAAVDERDLYNLKSLHLEQLAGDRKGQRSIRINEKWRLILRFRSDPAGRTVIVIELVDYH